MTEDGLKFLGLRLNKLRVFSSETRTRVQEEIHESVKTMFSPEVYNKLKKVSTVTEFGEVMKNYESNFSSDGNDYLTKIAETNFFGFVLACLNTKD
jgi:hypothetical protein